VLAGLGRLGWVARLDLRRLTRREGRALMVSLLGRDPGPELAERVSRRSGGNPLFLEALLRSDGGAGAELPESLRDLVLAGNPVVALNRAIAMAMVHGSRIGLDLLTGLAKDTRIATGHLPDAVRAQLLEMAGQPAVARAAYLEAARHTGSLPHQRYLHAQAARLTGDA
jgi:hypothetical protein